MLDPNMLKSFVRLISKEKDLEPEVLKEAIEHAILAVSRKQLSAYRDAVASLDVESGVLTVTVTKTVKEEAPKSDRQFIGLKEARKVLGTRSVKVGEEVRVPIDPSELGRIAAQSARQIVMQRLRDAERTKIFDEFKDKEGNMVTGIVQRFERRDVILNIGRTEAVLPYNEQPAGQQYRFNDRIKVLIARVEDTPRGPNIVCTRKSPQIVIELFKQEVPEIADGTVQIVGIAREPGVRTKIAVKSINSDVDPVGACVGMKGSRVQMVVRELENEKIDIVPWHPDLSTFIRNALNPAQIVGIQVDEEDRRADVIVAQGNLAIAIGRKGQNTKLAARLTGFRLDIRSENENELAYEEIQRRYLEDFLTQIEGLPELYQEAILRSSFNSVEKIAKANPDKLKPFTGDDEDLTEVLIGGAQDYLEALREMERVREAEEKAQAKAQAEAEAAGEGTAAGEAAESEETPAEAAEAEAGETKAAEGEAAESDEAPAEAAEAEAEETKAAEGEAGEAQPEPAAETEPAAAPEPAPTEDLALRKEGEGAGEPAQPESEAPVSGEEEK